MTNGQRITLVILLGLGIVLIAGIFFLLFKKNTTPPVTPSPTPIGITPTPVSQPTPPAQIAGTFYTWYIPHFMNPRESISSPQIQAAFAQWLTPDFAANLQTMARDTGANPLLLAQDYQNSWAKNIGASVVNQSSTTSTVLVSLGTGTELHKITVHLVFINNHWLISAITTAS